MKITKTFVKKLLPIIDAGLCSGLGQPKLGEMCVEAAVCYAKGEDFGDAPACVAIPVRKLLIALNDANWSGNAERAKGMRRIAIAQLGTECQIDEKRFAEMVAKISIEKTVPRALRSAAKIHPDKVHRDALERAAVDCETLGAVDAVDASRAFRAAADAAYAAYAADAARATARAAADAADAADAAYAAVYASRAAYATAYAADAADAAYAAVYASRAAAYAVDAADASRASRASRAADAARAAARATDIELAWFAEEVVQVLIQLKAPGTEWLYLTEGN